MLPTSPKTWRQDACRIVEELFPVTSRSDWDALLDLHHALRHGQDWGLTLDLFLAARECLEADHYLPFYRLRSLISVSLRLEAVGSHMPKLCLPSLLRGHHKSLADLKKRVRREWFEHLPEVVEKVPLRVVELV